MDPSISIGLECSQTALYSAVEPVTTEESSSSSPEESDFGLDVDWSKPQIERLVTQRMTNKKPNVNHFRRRPVPLTGTTCNCSSLESVPSLAAPFGISMVELGCWTTGILVSTDCDMGLRALRCSQLNKKLDSFVWWPDDSVSLLSNFLNLVLPSFFCQCKYVLYHYISVPYWYVFPLQIFDDLHGEASESRLTDGLLSLVTFI